MTKENQEFYFEHVCSGCPGSLWGSKSICRIHNCSIGQVEDCPEWKHYDAQGQMEDKTKTGEKLSHWNGLSEDYAEIMQQMEVELKDYHWMIREIERIRSSLKELGETSGSRYGVESSLPKPKGGKSDPVGREVQKRNKQWQRLEKLEMKVKQIDSAVEQVQAERERTVLECMLDGQRMNAIAHHVGVSRQRLNEIKRDLVQKLALQIYGEKIRGA